MSEWTAPGSDGDEAEHVLPPPPPASPGPWSNPPPGSAAAAGASSRAAAPVPGYPNAAYFDASVVQTPEQGSRHVASNVRLVGILSLFTCPVVASWRSCGASAFVAMRLAPDTPNRGAA